jgi:hypothetical protein
MPLRRNAPEALLPCIAHCDVAQPESLLVAVGRRPIKTGAEPKSLEKLSQPGRDGSRYSPRTVTGPYAANHI